MIRLAAIVPAVLLALGALGVLPAAADELMTFYMKNGATRGVAVELSSRERQTVWPGGGKVYFLDTGEKKSVPIECQAGENICYAAWVVGDVSTAWGIGPEGDLPCRNCCFVCVQKTTETIELME